MSSLPARLPRFVLQRFLRWYVERFGARMDEATRPLEAFETFVDFFTWERTDRTEKLKRDLGA